MPENAALLREILDELRRQGSDAAPLLLDEDDLGIRIGRRVHDAQMRARENGQMKLRTGTPPLQFNWELNVGHVLTIITIAIGFVVAYGQYTSRVGTIEQAIEAANSRAARYVPIIETAVKANDVQDERIQNLSVAIQELRRTNAEMMSVLGNIREDMAQVRAKLSIERRAPDGR